MDARNGRLGTAFGLDVHADAPLHFLERSSVPATGRRIDVELDVELDRRPPLSRLGELVCDERTRDGDVALQIRADERGYLISVPRYGAYWLAANGERARCATHEHAQERRQRLLVAQVLPFAAVLQGLEVFHASAVVCNGRAFAFLGASGVGKTSLALALTARGACFLTDDVLALERDGDALVGHPGPPLAARSDDDEIVMPAGRDEELVATTDDERIVAVSTADGPVPLGRMLLLERSASGPTSPAFAPAEDPRLLLTATFNFVLTAPARQRTLLEICALASREPLERVRFGRETDVEQLCTAVARRLD
jgi:hypothetical protein